MCRTPAFFVVALLSVASAGAADKNFYQVIDADGRVQLIEMPVEGAAAQSRDGSSEAGGSSSPVKQRGESPPGAASPSIDVPDASPSRSELPGTVSVPAAQVDQSSPDEYVDSELLDRSGFNPQSRKRFYLLDDGSGNSVRIEESDGQLRGFDPGSPSFYQPPAADRGIPIGAPSQEVTDTATLEGLFAFGRCLSPEQLKMASGIAKETPRSVVVDRRSWQFVGEGQPVLMLSVPGDGLRRLGVSSYSRTSKKPSFFIPIIAYADEEGCVVRASITGYFDARHEATKTRHPRVSGPIIMLSSERYLLAVLPKRPIVGLPAGVEQSELGELLFEIGNNE